MLFLIRSFVIAGNNFYTFLLTTLAREIYATVCIFLESVSRCWECSRRRKCERWIPTLLTLHHNYFDHYVLHLNLLYKQKRVEKSEFHTTLKMTTYSERWKNSKPCADTPNLDSSNPLTLLKSVCQREFSRPHLNLKTNNLHQLMKT